MKITELKRIIREIIKEELVNEGTYKVDKILKVVKNLIKKGYLQPWQIDDDKIFDIAAREKIRLNAKEVDKIFFELADMIESISELTKAQEKLPPALKKAIEKKEKNKSVNEAMKPSQVRSAISKVKKGLMRKWKQKGGYENFGQKELSQMRDKFDYNPYGSSDERQIAKMLDAFDNWAMNYDGNMREAYVVLHSPKKGVKPVTTAAYKDKKDAEKWAKDLGGITMIVKKKVKGIDEARRSVDYYGGKGTIVSTPFVSFWSDTIIDEKMDLNDPLLIRLRAAQIKRNQQAADRLKKAKSDKEKEKVEKLAKRNATKIKALKKKRADVMRDMEQEAEPEGGKIANRYGDLLNKIDNDIIKLGGNPIGESVKEAYFTPSSGTKAGGTHNLDYRKYLLKKDITGAKIGSYYNVTLPKGTIIYNLPGGVFAEHPSLKKYEDGLKKYHNTDKYGGIMITSTKDIIFSIEKNSRILESVSYGEFGKDKKTWLAANYVYDKSRKGAFFGELINYLNRQGFNLNKSSLYTITRKLYQTKDYTIVDNQDWKKSKIYHKSYAPINEAKDPEIITQLRDVLQNGYKTLKDPKSGKRMKVDTYSASAIVGVYDKLNPSNKEKFVKQGLLGMQSLAFKLLK